MIPERQKGKHITIIKSHRTTILKSNVTRWESRKTSLGASTFGGQIHFQQQNQFFFFFLKRHPPSGLTFHPSLFLRVDFADTSRDSSILSTPIPNYQLLRQMLSKFQHKWEASSLPFNPCQRNGCMCRWLLSFFLLNLLSLRRHPPRKSTMRTEGLPCICFLLL